MSDFFLKNVVDNSQIQCGGCSHLENDYLRGMTVQIFSRKNYHLAVEVWDLELVNWINFMEAYAKSLTEKLRRDVLMER